MHSQSRLAEVEASEIVRNVLHIHRTVGDKDSPVNGTSVSLGRLLTLPPTWYQWVISLAGPVAQGTVWSDRVGVLPPRLSERKNHETAHGGERLGHLAAWACKPTLFFRPWVVGRLARAMNGSHQMRDY